MKWFDKWRAVRQIQNSWFRKELMALPLGLEAYWQDSARQEFEGIRTDAFFFVRAAEGLMQFFSVVHRSRLPCALPSQAADSVWHAWLRWDPDGLERFCIEHFGAAIPHVERPGLGDGALLNTFVACCRRENSALYAAQLPALFRLDAHLCMPDGHGYWNRRGDILHARLGPRGRRLGRALPHPELNRNALSVAGLGRQRVAYSDGAGSMDGIGLAFIDGASDSSCSGSDSACDSGGGDAGSGCGSSCGGGCGGGGD